MVKHPCHVSCDLSPEDFHLGLNDSHSLLKGIDDFLHELMEGRRDYIFYSLLTSLGPQLVKSEPGDDYRAHSLYEVDIYMHVETAK